MLHFAAAIALSVFVPAAEPLPGELAHLTKLVGDEKALVDAVRRFDRQQQQLIEWDRKLAREHATEDKQDLAAGKMEDTRNRLRLISTAWKYVLSHYPNNARANTYYGELLYDYLNDKPAAVQQWLLAVKLDDDLSAPHNNLAIHYFHHGLIDKGLRHLGKALELEPKNPDYLYNAAQIYLNYFPQLGQRFEFSRKELYKEAMRLSRNAAKYAPNDFEILQDYATNFYAAENFGVEPDWRDAAEAWQRAREKATNDDQRFYTHLNEARTWLRAEKWEQAERALTEALTLRPDSEPAQRLMDKARSKT